MKRRSLVMLLLIATGGCLGTDVGNPREDDDDRFVDLVDDYLPSDASAPDTGYDSGMQDMASDPGIDLMEDAIAADFGMDIGDMDVLLDAADLLDCDFDWDVCGDTDDMDEDGE